MKYELRYTAKPAEVRGEGDKLVLVGVPIVYNAPSEMIGGWFEERIMPGAFDDSLRDMPDVYCFRDHNADRILGRVAAGTLRVKQEADCIRIECDAPRTSYAIDLAESIRRGDIRGMSFGFDVLTDDWYLREGKRCRDVTKGKLYEVSFVTIPAYPETSVGLRSVDQFKLDAESRLAVTDTEIRRRRLAILQHRV